MDGNGKDSFIGRLLGNAEKFTSEQVAQTVALLLEHGAEWQASDIHIEPHDKYVLVRYRIDGSLHGAHKITRGALTAIVNHFKELAHLETNGAVTPQQGQFTTKLHDQPYIIKLSTMPVLGGEKLVLHLTPEVQIPLQLDTLGFWGQSLSTVQAALARSHGLIIVAAPRHNGRPTTEASMLAALNNPSLNIATVEENVEYRIPHASQTAVNPRASFTLLKGLEAAMQQDPNVLMTTDLPDKATAEFVIQAGMNGHLVVAGMHSDASSSALMHLRALGIPSFMVASGVKTVIAQRLVRTLCEHCRERYELTAEQLHVLERMFGVTNAKAYQRVHELETQAIQLNIGNDPRPSSSNTQITHLWRPSREGCARCNHTGFNGRVALTEALTVGETVQKAILTPQTTSASLQSQAVREGFVPVALDGLIKALRGLVTIKDVLHVVDRSLRPGV